MYGTNAPTGCEREAASGARARLRRLLFLLLLAAPAALAQQADTFDAEYSRITSGAQTSTSGNGEFEVEGTIGVPEGSADAAGADVFDVDPGFVAGVMPPGMKPNEIFKNGYED